MFFEKPVVFAIALAGAAALAGSEAPRAANAPILTVQPMQGVSFDIGTKHASGYFLSDADACKLTVTLAEAGRDDEFDGKTAIRMTVAVEAGNSAHIDTVAGKSLGFKCQAGAKSMSIEPSNLAAY